MSRCQRLGSGVWCGMASDDNATRARLLGYIHDSRRNQRRLGIGVAIGVVAALITIALAPLVGKLALALVVIVGVCGFWVTAAHISDGRMQLGRLDQRAGGRAGRPSPRNTHTTSPG